MKTGFVISLVNPGKYCSKLYEYEEGQEVQYMMHAYAFLNEEYGRDNNGELLSPLTLAMVETGTVHRMQLISTPILNPRNGTPSVQDREDWGSSERVTTAIEQEQDDLALSKL